MAYYQTIIRPTAVTGPWHPSRGLAAHFRTMISYLSDPVLRAIIGRYVERKRLIELRSLS